MKSSKQQMRRMHSWSFARLKTYVEYKANIRGVKVVFVDPRYTSQTCSRCAHCEKANRKRSEFGCKKCGFKHNADLNASKNIRNLASFGISEASGLPVNQPIVASANSVTSLAL